jgi:glycosyltransferase involved in cell wall biosynthesis
MSRGFQLEQLPPLAMTFSIIIPTYNRRAIIGEAIESVLTQPETQQGRSEIVIVDDSTDDTVDVARQVAAREPALRLVTHKDARRLGVTGARNKAIELATGDVCIMLDSDDQLTPGALKFIADFFEEHPDVDLLFGRVTNKSGRPPRYRKDFLDRLVSYEELIQVDAVGEFIPVVRRRALIESELRYPAEAEGSEGILWRRLPRAGYKVWYSSQVLRLYDDMGVDRNSTPLLRVKRARVFAKGHLIELRDFGPDLLRLNKRAYAKKVLKATLYNRLAQPPDPEGDAYLRSLHPIVFGTTKLLPPPVLRKTLEWSVRAKLAGWI